MGGLATGTDAELTELIARLFGPHVTGVVARLDGPDPGPAYPEEGSLVDNAVPHRRREFLVGRACAHAALAAIGRDRGPILIGPRREPLWPAHVVGAIAHAGTWAGAVVTTTDRAMGLGLDIEPLEPPLPAGVEDLVLTAADRTRMPAGDDVEARRWAKVAYTAKECVYKALYPSTGWSLDHADVDVDIDLARGQWRAWVADTFPWDGPDLAGRFEPADGHLFAGILVAPSTTSG